MCACVSVVLFSLCSQSGSLKHRRPGLGSYMSTVMRDRHLLGGWRDDLVKVYNQFLFLLHYHTENKPCIFCIFTQSMFKNASLTPFNHHALAGWHQFCFIFLNTTINKTENNYAYRESRFCSMISERRTSTHWSPASSFFIKWPPDVEESRSTWILVLALYLPSNL